MLIPLKYNVHFFIVIPNDREITQKKQKPSPNAEDIKTAVFYRNEKVKIAQRLGCTPMLNKQFCINNVSLASTIHFMNKQHLLKGKKSFTLQGKKSFYRDANV